MLLLKNVRVRHVVLGHVRSFTYIFHVFPLWKKMFPHMWHSFSYVYISPLPAPIQRLTRTDPDYCSFRGKTAVRCRVLCCWNECAKTCNWKKGRESKGQRNITEDRENCRKEGGGLFNRVIVLKNSFVQHLGFLDVVTLNPRWKHCYCNMLTPSFHMWGE